jgi:hypothetical protein
MPPDADDPARHISASWSATGDLAVIYFPVGGEIKVKPDALNKGLKAQWYNPRNGSRTSVKIDPANGFRTPDKQDWTLLLRDAKK